ncbi:uncharacterized protein (DUF1800 family) [Flavobacterium sp. CG_23.5]|uniref:DUF1800 family protein n=1 Tax=unclassified Flavobacterium TaxID=196869 RepID=UPI0018C901F6|nr:MULTISPECIES: DUF1800 family protein [unclassified Flavobacterium]MBG6109965.1 uncharacterized protein (DUF1800 family) [Flavobacterium sp. CG_9.10]MBP2283206.1 uncharacterized protein (DUF1800 family) [Flavobacterium sp. CG_23.5]
MASLNPNTTVLGVKNAKHLLRRATFVYTKALIDQYSKLAPSQALDLLLVDKPLALNLPYDPLPTTAPDGFWTESANLPTSIANQYGKGVLVAGWWWYNAINTPTLKFKLSHFLSTRFTVIKNEQVFGSSTEFYDYIRLLLFYSYGNYKKLAKKMTLNNSMLCFLNNTSNVKSSPNENYAREFLELFTIGKGAQVTPGNYTNYTESDIVQTARILTGFKRKSDRSLIDSETGIPKGYNQFSDHNTSPKTFSSAFNNKIITSSSDASSMDTELDNYIEMVFDQSATAKNICRKLYTYFVKSNISSEVENDIINPLAQDLYNNGYEIVPIIRKLLESQHFYDLDDSITTDEIIGGIIKSPLQQLSEICTYLKAAIPDPTSNPLNFYNVFWWYFVNNTFFVRSNMILFEPENVAGHAAYYQAPAFDKTWISSSTLIAKYRLGESLLDGVNRISGNSNIAVKINISDVLKNTGIVSNPSNPLTLTSELCNALFAQETDSDRINYFMNSFLLQGLSNYYWTEAWNNFISTNNNSVVESRLKLLVTKILRAPESQMF